MRHRWIVGMVLGAWLLMTGSRGLAAESADPREIIEKALAAGESVISIPAGEYRIAPQNGVYFRLKNLHDVTIDFGGSKIIGLETQRFFEIHNCRNLAIKNLTLDYDPLPYTQAKITAILPDGSWQLEICRGYPDASLVRLSGDRRIEVYHPKSGALKVQWREGELERYGENGLLLKSDGKKYAARRGDIVVLAVQKTSQGEIPYVIFATENVNLTLENVTLYSGNSLGFTEIHSSNTTYRKCVVDRCPPQNDYTQREIPRMRSLNADAFHCQSAAIGPKYLNCIARYQADDCINIYGAAELVVGSNPDKGTVRLLVRSGNLDWQPGETLEAVTPDGERMAAFQLVSKSAPVPISSEEEAFLQTLNLRPDIYKASTRNALKFAVEIQISGLQTPLPRGAQLFSANRCGNGFVVENCILGPNRTRNLLCKGSNGRIVGNILTGAHYGAALHIVPEYQWMECGYSDELEISGNVINRTYKCPGVLISAVTGSGAEPPKGSHREIQFVGNQVSQIDGVAVELHGCSGTTFLKNRIVGKTLFKNCQFRRKDVKK